MARPRKDRVAFSVSRATREQRELWEHVASSIRTAILSGAIPAGASLVEADLADRFAVSRGPIREALRELAREGLVVNLPRRGTVVSTLSFADLTEAYAIREGLEIVAAKQAMERATNGELAQLRPQVAKMEDAWDRGVEYGKSLAADLAFHRSLVALARNERLAAIYEQMLSQTHLLVRTAALANPSLRLALRRAPHRDILNALVRRDVDRARTAIEEHYVYALERLLPVTPDSPAQGVQPPTPKPLIRRSITQESKRAGSHKVRAPHPRIQASRRSTSKRSRPGKVGRT